jgi:hypothetical protein
MGVIRFFERQNLSAQEAEIVEVYSAIHPMGTNNFLDVVFNALALSATGGTPTFGWNVYTGNDGERWVKLTDFSSITTSTGETRETGAVRGAYLKIGCTLFQNGAAPEDVGFVTFEVTGNVLRSST